MTTHANPSTSLLTFLGFASDSNVVAAHQIKQSFLVHLVNSKFDVHFFVEGWFCAMRRVFLISLPPSLPIESSEWGSGADNSEQCALGILSLMTCLVLAQ